jgi:hypothetical protein
VNYTLADASALSKYYIDAIEGHMKRDHKNLSNKNDIARYAYYYFRNIAFSKARLTVILPQRLAIVPSTIFTK